VSPFGRRLPAVRPGGSLWLARLECEAPAAWDDDDDGRPVLLLIRTTPIQFCQPLELPTSSPAVVMAVSSALLLSLLPPSRTMVHVALPVVIICIANKHQVIRSFVWDCKRESAVSQRINHQSDRKAAVSCPYCLHFVSFKEKQNSPFQPQRSIITPPHHTINTEYSSHHQINDSSTFLY